MLSLPIDEPILELKTLPSTLKYAFLDEEKAKLVIISSKLDIKKDEQLLDVLRWNEDAIGDLDGHERVRPLTIHSSHLPRG